jgi:hypothetical protein
MSESDAPGHDIARSKKALKRVRSAHAAVRSKAEARARAQSLLFLEDEWGVIAGGQLYRELSKAQNEKDTEQVAFLEQQMEELDVCCQVHAHNSLIRP